MAAEMNSRRGSAPMQTELPDLPAQLESLLHLVWQCEKEWRLDDRIDLALRREEGAAQSTRARRPHHWLASS